MSNGFQYNITHHESSCHSLFAIFTNTFTYLQIRSLQDHKRRSCSIVFNPTLCNCAYFYNGSRRKDKYCYVAQGNTFMTHVLVCYWACGLLNANKSLPLIGCYVSRWTLLTLPGTRHRMWCAETNHILQNDQVTSNKMVHKKGAIFWCDPFCCECWLKKTHLLTDITCDSQS